MIQVIATCLLVALLMTGVLVSGIPVFISYASTDEGGGDTGGDGGGTSDEGTESSDEGTEPEPEPEAEPEPEPEAKAPTEETDNEPVPAAGGEEANTCMGGQPGTDGCPPAAPATTEPDPLTKLGELVGPPKECPPELGLTPLECLDKVVKSPATEGLPPCDGSAQDCVTSNGDVCLEGQGGHECECAEDMSDCPNHPSLLEPPITEPREPLPYCDLVPRGTQEYSCHDRRDYDDITGLYPCNDGTQKEHFLDCPDVSGKDYDEYLDQEPIDPCLLDPDNSPTCPPPDENGICPEGYNMNESGNCYPEHPNGCPTGYHGHEDDESGRCIPNTTPCDDGFILNLENRPTCERKESYCQTHQNNDKCKFDSPEESEHKKTIIINKVILEINSGKHHDAFPEVDIIGLSTKQNGDSMVCLMDIDDDDVQCQDFGMPADRVAGSFWRVIETNSDKDYDNGNTGSNEVDDAITAIKGQDFSGLDDLDNHDFGIDLAWIAINPTGDGFVCLTEDQTGKGPSLCEPFKVSSADVSGQITEGVEFS